MSFNSFGHILKLTTFGESHGPAIGGVLDGFPAGIELDLAAIQTALDARKPGRNRTSLRQEPDQLIILSGLMNQVSTGSPIAFMITNSDAKASAYQGLEQLIRPGHACATYHEKFGHLPQSGGGRASARETAMRVAAGAISAHLFNEETQFMAWLDAAGQIQQTQPLSQIKAADIKPENLFYPDPSTYQQVEAHLDALIVEGDSTGGVVRFMITNPPRGLGEPIYQKLDAILAHAMLSIPASKGFEIGLGYKASQMQGSTHNDTPINTSGQSAHNHAGGLLGGISNGDPIYGSVAFKPTSSIGKAQKTLDFTSASQTIAHNKEHRHDPCVAVRAVPVVKAMCQLVLADMLLCHQARKSNP